MPNQTINDPAELTACTEAPFYLPLDWFAPSTTNPRSISDEDFDRLRRDVADERMQKARPIIVDLHERDIVGGNMRYRAKLANGDTMGWFWVEDFSGPGGQDRREEWIFRDNGEYGDWVPEAVAQILAARKERGSSLDVLGMRQQRVEELIRVAGYSRRKTLGDPEATPPEPDVPVTQSGDLIRLGQHVLLCGNSTNANDLERAIRAADDQVAMIFTDPPYGVGYNGGMKPREELDGDERGTTIYDGFLGALAGVCGGDALMLGAAMYLWHADREIGPVVDALREHGWAIHAGIVWEKNNAQFMTNAHYKHLHEPLLYCGRTIGPLWYGPNNETTVWKADRSPRNDFHPTQKPVELAERAMANSSRPGDVVLDAFGGSGSTLIAGESQKRQVVMLELKPSFCDVIVARWEAFTGDRAKRP